MERFAVVKFSILCVYIARESYQQLILAVLELALTFSVHGIGSSSVVLMADIFDGWSAE